MTVLTAIFYADLQMNTVITEYKPLHLVLFKPFTIKSSLHFLYWYWMKQVINNNIVRSLAPAAQIQTSHLFGTLQLNIFAFSTMELLAEHQEEHPACKRIEWWGAGMVSCLAQDANDLHMVQMICIWSNWCHCHPIISCFIKIKIGLTVVVPANPDSSWRGH